MTWLLERLCAILRAMPWRVPYERRVLYALAWGRDAAAATVGVLAWEHIGWYAVGIAAGFAAIVWSDFVAYALRGKILGYSYNANVAAPGEWEAWAGPLSEDDICIWEHLKMVPLRPWDGAPH